MSRPDALCFTQAALQVVTCYVLSLLSRGYRQAEAAALNTISQEMLRLLLLSSLKHDDALGRVPALLLADGLVKENHRRVESSSKVRLGWYLHLLSDLTEAVVTLAGS